MNRQPVQEKITWEKIEWRYQGRRWIPKRLKVYTPWDRISGGLPNSLTIFAGEPGSGKSLLARSLAVHADELGYDVVYILCESYADNPNFLKQNTNIHVADYTRMIPKWSRAVEEVFVAQEHFDADLIVIDSVTQFFSGTNKAVEEAEIRGALKKLANRAEDIGVSIIGTSEVRGSGNFLYPAGGRAVDHRAWLYVWFDKIVVNRWEARDYGLKIGEKLFTIEFVKDKHGLADATNLYVVDYPKPYSPKFTALKDFINNHKNAKNNEEDKDKQKG